MARLIDHTQLRAFATEVDIRELCDEALACNFAFSRSSAAKRSWSFERFSFCRIKSPILLVYHLS